MNSDHAPTAEQLPPHEVTQEDLAVAVQWMQLVHSDSGVVQVFAERLASRERQMREMLSDSAHCPDCGSFIRFFRNASCVNFWHEVPMLAALRENREIKAGTLCPVCTGHPVSDRQCICGGSGDAQDAYSGLLKDYLKLESNCAEKDAKIAELTRLLGDEHRADVIINEIVKKYMADAEAAEAKLRAVSDALDSDELEAHQLPSGDFYWAVDVDARDARIREAIKVKVRICTNG